MNEWMNEWMNLTDECIINMEIHWHCTYLETRIYMDRNFCVFIGCLQNQRL